MLAAEALQQGVIWLYAYLVIGALFWLAAVLAGVGRMAHPFARYLVTPECFIVFSTMAPLVLFLLLLAFLVMILSGERDE